VSYAGIDLSQLADLPPDVVREGRRVAEHLSSLAKADQERSQSNRVAQRRKALLQVRPLTVTLLNTVTRTSARTEADTGHPVPAPHRAEAGARGVHPSRRGAAGVHRPPTARSCGIAERDHLRMREEKALERITYDEHCTVYRAQITSLFRTSDTISKDQAVSW
jgi:hypothetical protein